MSVLGSSKPMSPVQAQGANQGLEAYDRLSANFDPNHPPMLEHYDQLSNHFLMPSKNLLEMEKRHYIDHMNKLRHTAKFMVKRA